MPLRLSCPQIEGTPVPVQRGEVLDLAVRLCPTGVLVWGSSSSQAPWAPVRVPMATERLPLIVVITALAFTQRLLERQGCLGRPSTRPRPLHSQPAARSAQFPGSPPCPGAKRPPRRPGRGASGSGGVPAPLSRAAPAGSWECPQPQEAGPLLLAEGGLVTGEGCQPPSPKLRRIARDQKSIRSQNDHQWKRSPPAQVKRKAGRVPGPSCRALLVTAGYATTLRRQGLGGQAGTGRRASQACHWAKSPT